MERADNFKKTLDAFFDGSRPVVSAPTTSSGPGQGNGSPGNNNGPDSSPQTPKPSRQPVSPTSEAGQVLSSSTFINLESFLVASKDAIDNELFLYQTPAFQWIPSTVYRYDDFIESLYVMSTDGVAGKKFYIGEDVDHGHIYGLINIAAFLAQSMKETIQYDACDENSVRLIHVHI